MATTKPEIKGVVIKTLVTHRDQRGFFRELIRVSDEFFSEFGQWSQSIMYEGVIKAWHFHRKQTDWWYVSHGVLKVALHDLREDSPTFRVTQDFLMGEHQEPIVVAIPPGVAHGCKVVSGPAGLFYVTSSIYDPKDEGRLGHDDPLIGYDWLEAAPIT